MIVYFVLNHVVYQHHYKTWKEDSLKDACKAVHNGMPIKSAAEEYGVPKLTIYDHFVGRY